MYSVLKDIRTGTYYMEGNKTSFFAYTDESSFDIKKIPQDDRKYIRLVMTDIDDQKELETELFNAGFYEGKLDDKTFHMKRSLNLYYYDRNPNELSYARYILTKDKRYLTYIKKDKLYTLARIDNSVSPGDIYFPIVKYDDDRYLVITYTNEERFPKEFVNKYKGWKTVRMTWDMECVVNDRLLLP